MVHCHEHRSKVHIKASFEYDDIKCESANEDKLKYTRILSSR